jgi:DNA-directed RNA polymerase specialized sigma subunit
MRKLGSVEKLLLEYRFNKERVGFLEKQLSRLTPEADSDYIESKMFSPGNSGKTLCININNNEEVVMLNKVEETAENYSLNCLSEYKRSLKSIREEVTKLKSLVAVVEDSLNILEKSHGKYKLILEKYYIDKENMEDIAEIIHLSSSRCYGLCKEAVKYLERVIYG